MLRDSLLVVLAVVLILAVYAAVWVILASIHGENRDEPPRWTS